MTGTKPMPEVRRQDEDRLITENLRRELQICLPPRRGTYRQGPTQIYSVPRGAATRRPVLHGAATAPRDRCPSERFMSASDVPTPASAPVPAPAPASGTAPEPKFTKEEFLKEGSRQLRGTIAQELGEAHRHFIEDNAKLLKHHGTYQQDDQDHRKDKNADGTRKGKAYMFMVRTRDSRRQS